MPRFYRIIWGQHPYAADIMIHEGSPEFEAIDKVMNPGPKKTNEGQMELNMSPNKKQCPECDQNVIVSAKGIVIVHWGKGLKCKTSGTLYERWRPQITAKEKEKSNG